MRKGFALVLVFALMCCNGAYAQQLHLDTIDQLFGGDGQECSVEDLFASCTSFENAYGTYRLSDVFAYGDVLRYVVECTPKESNARFVYGWAENPLAEAEIVYDAYSYAPSVEGWAVNAEFECYERGRQLILCNTLLFAAQNDLPDPFSVTVHTKNMDGQFLSMETVMLPVQTVEGSRVQTVAVRQFVRDVFVDSIRVSISPRDIACIMFSVPSSIEPADVSNILFGISTASTTLQGGGMPSEGIAYSFMRRSAGETLSLDPLIIRDGDNALVCSADGRREWVPFASLVVGEVEPDCLEIR